MRPPNTPEDLSIFDLRDKTCNTEIDAETHFDTSVFILRPDKLYYKTANFLLGRVSSPGPDVKQDTAGQSKSSNDYIKAWLSEFR